jgi:hypothetical protein
MQNEWKGFEQVSNDKCCQSRYSSRLTQVANAVCNLPKIKVISKSKADQRQKTF